MNDEKLNTICNQGDIIKVECILSMVSSWI